VSTVSPAQAASIQTKTAMAAKRVSSLFFMDKFPFAVGIFSIPFYHKTEKSQSHILFDCCENLRKI
jgi:hypothetical protein